MRFGHNSFSRLVSQEMKSETMKTWAYILNSSCEIVEGLDTMRNKPPRETELHKEEMKSRIRKDQIDRQVLRTKIENSIAILETNQHPKDGLVNITTGKIITDLTKFENRRTEFARVRSKAPQRVLRSHQANCEDIECFAKRCQSRGRRKCLIQRLCMHEPLR